MPERDLRAMRENRWRPGNTAMGLILVALMVAGGFLAFTKHIPFTGHGYELQATFRNAINIRVKSPVRIAGVDVGEVQKVERDGDYATITFTVSDEGQPVRDDAFITLRPRMFLEGNFFLDLEPGSPAGEELHSGELIPVTRTSTAVQFDQVLAALQSPVRQDLSELLIGYGEALNHKPTKAEDKTQDPAVYGKSGAEALNMTFDYGGDAGRGSAQVLEAFRGTEPRDLRRMIAASGQAFGALGAQEQDLQDLITNWNTFTGALASESHALGDTVHELGPAIEAQYAATKSLNAALPPLRTWAKVFEPGVAELPETFAKTRPWLAQAKPLLAPRQLGEISELLRRSTPGFAEASAAGYGATGQLDDLTSCTTNVLVPTGAQQINDPFAIPQPTYREFFYSTVDIGGESQNYDGNGPYLRIQPGGGAQFTTTRNPQPSSPTDSPLWGYTFDAPTGTQPLLGPKPAYKPEAKCNVQGVPDLNGPAAGPGSPSPRAYP
jgi:ABC-type transporter Mla subunit MlaD